MFIYQILFQKAVLPRPEMASFLDDASFFVRSLRANGQLVSCNEIFLFQDDEVSLHVQCLRKDSLDRRYNSDYVNQWTSILSENYGVNVSYKFVGEHPVLVPTADIDSSTSLILYWGGASPVRSGDSFEPIPLYKIPYTNTRQKSYEDIHAWSNSYASLDGLWFRGSVGEKRFYNYLADIRSPLTRQGRSICTRLEGLTGKPAYYYLLNDDSRKIEQGCPSCGAEWEIDRKLLDRFDLRCVHCRLLSEKVK